MTTHQEQMERSGLYAKAELMRYRIQKDLKTRVEESTKELEGALKVIRVYKHGSWTEISRK
jgi:hypothetical protein